MIYTDRKFLNVLQIENDTLSVSFDILGEMLMEKPSNMIYCEKANRLYGIISTGDVYRAKKEGQNEVIINTSFTFLNGFQYMKARKIFSEKEMINSLPIVDENHKLLGDYSRWDDVFSVYGLSFLKKNKFADVIWKKYRNIAIVSPSGSFPQKIECFEKMIEFFLEIGVDVEVINKKEVISAFELKDVVFFLDEDEKRGLGTLYKVILGKDFKWEQAKTLEDVRNSISEMSREAIGETVLRNIMDSGIYLMTLQMKRTDDFYWRKLYKEIDLQWEKIGKSKSHSVPKEFWEDFFDELYSYEYASSVSQWSFIHVKNGISQRLKDITSEFNNVKDGERLTTDQPTDYEKTIYFFGPCLIVGAYNEDKYTIESFLQRTLNQEGYKVRVINCGCWSNEMLLLLRILSTDFKIGDIAIVYNQNKSYNGIPSLNLVEFLEKENAPSKWFLNSVLHTNYKGNKLFADAIYHVLPKSFLNEKAKEKTLNPKLSVDAMVSDYCEMYFDNDISNGIVGSIVMNCNPFTNGHRYLIEEASKRVDSLIIFVVEENKSLFSFKERFAMVKEGTKDIKNVLVVPSGEFILSEQTFPQYFIKLEDDNVSSNAEFDIKLFGEGIASKLNIKYRFVGEEKDDPVTRMYNDAMKKILPSYGIELVEIPKKIERNGNAIRATNVRLRIENGDMDAIKEIVPETTKEILMMTWE